MFDNFIGKKIIIEDFENDFSSKDGGYSKTSINVEQDADFLMRVAIEQLKQKLLEEENARKKAEELVEEERVQRRLLEECLKKEYEKHSLSPVYTSYNVKFEDDTTELVKTYDEAGVNKLTIDGKENITEKVNVQHEVSNLENQREMLARTLKAPMQKLVNVLHEIAVQDSEHCFKSMNSTNKQIYNRKENITEKVNVQHEVSDLENQREMLARTLKAPMQKLVNVLHEIAVQDSKSCSKLNNRPNITKVKESSNTSYYRPVSEYFSTSYSLHTYSSVGEQYVSGYWRRRNGKLEYVRPHIRRR